MGLVIIIPADDQQAILVGDVVLCVNLHEFVVPKVKGIKKPTKEQRRMLSAFARRTREA